MTEIENHTLALLREMRQENASFREEVLMRLNAIELHQEQQTKKLDKLGVDLLGVRGRIKNMEDAMGMIARVVSEGAGV